MNRYVRLSVVRLGRFQASLNSLGTFEMLRAKTLSLLSTWVLCLGVAGCSSPSPSPYAGIDASRQLQVNAQDKTGRVPYLFTTQVNWSSYESIYLEPVTVYAGADSQFGDVDNEQRQALARYMDHEFHEALKGRFRLTRLPSPHALRLRLTLTGAQKNTPYLAPFSRFDIGLAPYNLLQSLRDRQGSFTGSVSYMVEIYDADTSRLLESYITRQYPKALNIASTRGALTAARVGIDLGAQDLSWRLSHT